MLALSVSVDVSSYRCPCLISPVAPFRLRSLCDDTRRRSRISVDGALRCIVHGSAGSWLQAGAASCALSVSILLSRYNTEHRRKIKASAEKDKEA